MHPLFLPKNVFLLSKAANWMKHGENQHEWLFVIFCHLCIVAPCLFHLYKTWMQAPKRSLNKSWLGGDVAAKQATGWRVQAPPGTPSPTPPVLFFFISICRTNVEARTKTLWAEQRKNDPEEKSLTNSSRNLRIMCKKIQHNDSPRIFWFHPNLNRENISKGLHNLRLRAPTPPGPGGTVCALGVYTVFLFMSHHTCKTTPNLVYHFLQI